MKRNVLFLILLFVSMWILSCTKEKPIYSYSSIQQSDEQLVSNVHWFMNAAKDVKEGKILKDDNKMLIDSALYYISATLNYKYCHHTEYSGKFLQDTVYVKIPILAAEGKTLLVDALKGYNASLEGIRAKYARILNSDKKITGCMVNNLGITQGGDSLNIQIVSQFRYAIGQNLLLNNQTQFQFGENEKYWWLRDSYNCYNGSSEDGGAPNVIQNTIMFAYCPAPPPNCRYWFPQYTDISFVANDPSFEVDLIKDNFCDYKIFYASGTIAQVLNDDVQCLGTDTGHPGEHEMNFYCYWLNEIVYDFFLQHESENLSCKEIQIYSPAPYPPNPNNPSIIAIKHVPHLFYGKRYLICNEPQYPIEITMD